jgi:hypothetical protein
MSARLRQSGVPGKCATAQHYLTGDHGDVWLIWEDHSTSFITFHKFDQQGHELAKQIL